MDKERNRVSLGMKNSYIKDEELMQTPSRQNHDFAIGMNDSVVSAETTMLPQRNSDNTNNESDVGHHPILADAESRALVPPLEVPLDDIESLDIEGDVSQSVVNVANADTIEDNNKKRAKKKAREER